jgi:nitroimidazol reductase NimA-like FMN-containing flavoprotein (pyridoxamine 5'-phosphate oxidase superfamily)
MTKLDVPELPEGSHAAGMEERSTFAPTPQTTIRRLPARGSYDRALAYSILDEALVCTVGFVVDGDPFVIPMAFARHDDRLVLHGAPASRLLGALATGVRACATVTLVDGIVLARSAFHHSMNYRSVVVLGNAVEITDLSEKRAALERLVEHVLPGRSQSARAPNQKELVSTRVLSMPIEQASVKSRSGGPLDDESDADVACWSGHVPLRLTPLAPVADEKYPPRSPLPDAVLRYRRGT